MKTNELKELGADELAAKIREVRKEKPARMRFMRREIARMLTVQNMAKKEAK